MGHVWIQHTALQAHAFIASCRHQGDSRDPLKPTDGSLDSSGDVSITYDDGSLSLQALILIIRSSAGTVAMQVPGAWCRRSPRDLP